MLGFILRQIYSLALTAPGASLMLAGGEDIEEHPSAPDPVRFVESEK